MKSPSKKFKTVSIVGFGRFGKLLAETLKADFDVSVYNYRNIKKEIERCGYRAVSMETAMSSDAVFFAPPISKFEEVIRNAQDLIHRKKPKLLIDVLSVKIYPRRVFEKYLSSRQEVLLTHPMFGPDSVKSNGGLVNLKIMMDKFTASRASYSFWKKYFTSKGLRVAEMTADKHDRLAARSQGVAHFIGRILEDFRFMPTPIDTLGAERLHEVKTLAINDTLELFRDLQKKNPYTKKMRVKLDGSVKRVRKLLEPISETATDMPQRRRQRKH